MVIIPHNKNSLLIGKNFHALQKFVQKFTRTLIMKNMIMLITNENIDELFAR